MFNFPKRKKHLKWAVLVPTLPIRLSGEVWWSRAVFPSKKEAERQLKHIKQKPFIKRVSE